MANQDANNADSWEKPCNKRKLHFDRMLGTVSKGVFLELWQSLEKIVDEV